MLYYNENLKIQPQFYARLWVFLFLDYNNTVNTVLLQPSTQTWEDYRRPFWAADSRPSLLVLARNRIYNHYNHWTYYHWIQNHQVLQIHRDTLDTSEYIWIHLDTSDTFGYIWIHLDTSGYIWIHLDTFGYIWIHLDAFVNKWIYLEQSDPKLWNLTPFS